MGFVMSVDLSCDGGKSRVHNSSKLPLGQSVTSFFVMRCMGAVKFLETFNGIAVELQAAEGSPDRLHCSG